MSDSNKSWIPHFSEFYLRLLKLSIWEKIPDRCLEKPLKLIQATYKKSGQVPDIVIFFSFTQALFLIQAKLELFIFTQFLFYSSLWPRLFYVSKQSKTNMQSLKLVSNMHLPIVYWISWFESGFSYMKYEVYSTKKKHKWIQHLSNFKRVKFNFKQVSTYSFILISRQDGFPTIFSLPPLNCFNSK